MPVITAVGEPGPSCSGNAGRPRSRVMVMYYDARSGGVGVTAGGNGYVAGGNRQFDVRIAEASACNKDGLGRLVFGASQQMSRYSLSSTAAARHRPDARLRLHRRQPRLRNVLRRDTARSPATTSI